jgi:hypothetical protein
VPQSLLHCETSLAETLKIPTMVSYIQYCYLSGLCVYLHSKMKRRHFGSSLCSRTQVNSTLLGPNEGTNLVPGHL